MTEKRDRIAPQGRRERTVGRMSGQLLRQQNPAVRIRARRKSRRLQDLFGERGRTDQRQDLPYRRTRTASRHTPIPIR